MEGSLNEKVFGVIDDGDTRICSAPGLVPRLGVTVVGTDGREVRGLLESRNE